MPQITFLDNFKNFFWLCGKTLNLNWQASRTLTTSLIITNILSGIVPSLEIYIGKLIIDQIVKALQTANPLLNLQPIIYLLFIGLLVEIASTIINNIQGGAAILLRDYLNRFVQQSFLTKHVELDLSFFEDPEFRNQYQKVERESSYRAGGLVRTVFAILRNTISLFSSFILLSSLGWGVLGILLIISLPNLLTSLQFAKYRYSISDTRTPISRRFNYITSLISNIAAAEIKLFGLGQYFLQKFQGYYQEFIKDSHSLTKKEYSVETIVGSLSGLSYYIIYFWLILKVLAKTATLGDLTLYGSAYQRTQSTLWSLFSNIGEAYESLLFLQNYFDFMNLKPKIVWPQDGLIFTKVKKLGVEFRNVTFGYDKDKPPVLKNINLKIEQNQEIALVGENGAGKTTLIKLLARIYDPWEGRILINGVDLKEYDLSSLYQKIGVLAQNFVQYQLTVKENIGFGKLEKVEDIEAVKQAAEMAAINDYIETLPQKYNTILGRQFEGGCELSGGQWQRVALARAFFRDPEILILDEPTASLDAKAENEIFGRIYQLIRDKIVIIISHRFSTVRLAKKIYVLEEGQIVEQGSHDELMAKKGLYEEMFTLQAKGYQ